MQIWYHVITVVAGIVVPLLIWWLTEQQHNLRDKQKEIARLYNLIDKLETDLIYTKNQIDNIHKQFAHRSEYAKLKYQILIDQIADLNNWLKTHTNFIPRINSTSKDFITMTDYDDENNPNTGLY